MKARCEALFPGEIVDAFLVERPSQTSREEKEIAIALYKNVEVQLDPPGAMGCIILSANPNELIAIEKAGYRLALPVEGSADACYRNAIAAFYRRDYQAAISFHTQATERDPGYVLAYYGRAFVYATLLQTMGYMMVETKDGQRYSWRDARAPETLASAIADFSKTIELDPTISAAFGMRATMYQMQNEPQKALPDWRAAAALGDETAKKRLKELGEP